MSLLPEVSLLTYLGITVGLIVLGYSVGRVRERHHLAELDRREAESSAIVVVDVKGVPPGFDAADGELVMGEVVIAADYFKTFAAGIKGIFGGELKTYETLLRRARREARLRMVEQARNLGAEVIVNTRFEWSDIGPGPSAEILCYGTAIIPTRT